MKKIILAALALCMIAALSACSSYSKRQTPEQQNQPLSCEGLHMRGATWHFTDENGQAVDAIGSCKKGMKHGSFKFTVNGEVVAKSKFSKDKEVKTSCVAGGKKTRTPLEQCMKAVAQNEVPQGEAISDAEAAADDNEAED